MARVRRPQVLNQQLREIEQLPLKCLKATARHEETAPIAHTVPTTLTLTPRMQRLKDLEKLSRSERIELDAVLLQRTRAMCLEEIKRGLTADRGLQVAMRDDSHRTFRLVGKALARYAPPASNKDALLREAFAPLIEQYIEQGQAKHTAWLLHKTEHRSSLFGSWWPSV